MTKIMPKLLAKEYAEAFVLNEISFTGLECKLWDLHANYGISVQSNRISVKSNGISMQITGLAYNLPLSNIYKLLCYTFLYWTLPK